MLDYITKRIALDFDFLSNYWWIYISVVVLVFGIWIFDNYRR